MRKCAAVVALALALVGDASAQWSFVSLHRAEFGESYGYGVSADGQVGYIGVGTSRRASLWHGTAASWEDLAPSGNTPSAIYSTAMGRQAGEVLDHAAVWSGTASSWIDLHPSAASRSVAFGTDGSQQVGRAQISNEQHASLWNGTAESWVDLHPLGGNSVAHAVHAGQQVGTTQFTGGNYASLWTGTAASWTPLNPAGHLFAELYGVHNGRQVGTVGVGVFDHASLWSGTPESWIDLHPQSFYHSDAYGVFGDAQVGLVSDTISTFAAFWNGTPGSFVNLHSFLPANFIESQANAVWSDGVNYYVVGTGRSVSGGHFQSIMWVAPVPEPASALVLGAAIAALCARRRKNA